ncbi:unnamed protein product [Lymnaea stagnalis]|uniref:Uncharacterized protein n=1 Tax=Lymnaea stagnalis TaxID=6523 RepID=A0AAV2ISU2_LYMST
MPKLFFSSLHIQVYVSKVVSLVRGCHWCLLNAYVDKFTQSSSLHRNKSDNRSVTSLLFMMSICVQVFGTCRPRSSRSGNQLETCMLMTSENQTYSRPVRGTRMRTRHYSRPVRGTSI